MEHIAAVLLIIGCSNDFTACRELPAPVPLFETAKECNDELPLGLRSVTGQRPRILAQCVAVDPALEEEDAQLVWNVTPNGKLEALISAPDVMIVSDFKRTNAEYFDHE
jgi:hypothetical protein